MCLGHLCARRLSAFCFSWLRGEETEGESPQPQDSLGGSLMECSHQLPEEGRKRLQGRLRSPHTPSCCGYFLP